jgi:hypothetical protein
MVPAPETFDGTLADLFDRFIEPNLPTAAEVEAWHRRIVSHCEQPDTVFLLRQVRGLERGTMYSTSDGYRLVPTDNAPGWWMHFVTFNGIRDVDFIDAPTHFHEVPRRLPTTISAAGWHVAHMLNAKDRNTDWHTLSRRELVRRFVRNLHPCNLFYIPKSEWQRHGGDPHVIGFFASVYAWRYGAVWTEFLRLAEGEPPPGVPMLRYACRLKRATRPFGARVTIAADGDRISPYPPPGPPGLGDSLRRPDDTAANPPREGDRIQRSQRDFMRELARQFGRDENRVVHEYAASEERGEVQRGSNKRGMEALAYARRLWADGIKKGWL